MWLGFVPHPQPCAARLNADGNPSSPKAFLCLKLVLGGKCGAWLARFNHDSQGLFPQSCRKNINKPAMKPALDDIVF